MGVFPQYAFLLSFNTVRNSGITEFVNFAAEVLAEAGPQTDVEDESDPQAQKIEPLWLVNAVVVWGDNVQHEQLRQHPTVEMVHEDFVYPAPHFEQLETQAGEDSDLWNLELLKVSKFRQDYGLTGANVKIGILDTGIDPTHPALSPRLKGFALVEEGKGPATVTKAFEPALEPLVYGHGTSVAGVLVSAEHGIAIEADLYVVSVLNRNRNGETTWSMVNEGLQWLISQQVDVINLSLGGGDGEGRTDLDETFRACDERGIALIAAIGNVPQGRSLYPGKSPFIFSVGAINRALALRKRSGSGDNLPAVVAPGEQILTTVPGGGTKICNGTSIAAPHVTALFALLKQAKPEIEAEVILEAIRGASSPLATAEPKHQGSGLISFEKSLQVLKERTQVG